MHVDVIHMSCLPGDSNLEVGTTPSVLKGSLLFGRSSIKVKSFFVHIGSGYFGLINVVVVLKDCMSLIFLLYNIYKNV